MNLQVIKAVERWFSPEQLVDAVYVADSWKKRGRPKKGEIPLPPDTVYGIRLNILPPSVEAFAYIMMLSVMVYSLMEYLIRQQMKKEKEPLDLLGRRKSFRPTEESVLEILDTVQIAHMEQNGSYVRSDQNVSLTIQSFDWIPF